jgi:hypothetical protein
VSPNRTRTTIPPALASDAHSAAGRHERKTAGPATVGMNGTLSTPEVCARPASTNGLRRSASLVPGGRRIPTGMPSERVSGAKTSWHKSWSKTRAPKSDDSGILLTRAMTWRDRAIENIQKVWERGTVGLLVRSINSAALSQGSEAVFRRIAQATSADPILDYFAEIRFALISGNWSLKLNLNPPEGGGRIWQYPETAKQHTSKSSDFAPLCGTIARLRGSGTN